ncbi:hypothetical protein ACFLYF_06065 [Chloroflexota bacterium]
MDIDKRVGEFIIAKLKDSYYADNRDLIKWGGIIHLCNTSGIKHIIQVAYFRESSWLKLLFDGEIEDIPKEVIEHFRDIDDIKRLGKKLGITIDIVKDEFSKSNRGEYTKDICQRIQEQAQRQIVFLDPDTGLAPQKATAEHVTREEISLIWQYLKRGDYLVLYQHNPHIEDWENIRRIEFAQACNTEEEKISTWKASEKFNDVVLFFCVKYNE